jgi:hypothetical protein
MGRDGRVRTDGGGQQTAGHWTGGQQTAGPWTTPGNRTPDGLDSRTPDDDIGMGGHPTMDTDRPLTPRLVSWQCRPRRRRPTAGWRRKARRADAVWASNNPGQLSSTGSEAHHAATDGPGHRRDGPLQVLRLRPAGASAHCCRVLDLDGTRRGQWDYGKVRRAESGWCGSADEGGDRSADVGCWSVFVLVDGGKGT